MRKRKNIKIKLAVTAAVLMGFIIGGNGYTDKSSLCSHLEYVFFHANLFHLLCNVFVLWTIRGRMEYIPAYIISILASYLPQFTIAPTVGMSGFLFAIFGIMWGRTGLFLKMMKAGFPFIVFTSLIPMVNGALHLYCYLLGYCYGYSMKRFFHI